MQSAAAFAQGSIEEVIVTAQKRQQDINRVGITMQAFTATMLKDAGVHSADDLEALTPGLTVTSTAPNGVPVYSIRGVGFADFATASSSTVGLYSDDVAIPYAVMSRDILFDIERVEVLKGPQGDLYGRNTTAGQINFISRKPTEDFQAGVSLDFSRFDVLDAEGFVSGPITDKLRVRLATKLVQSDQGWQHSISRPGDTLGRKNEAAVRGLVSYDISSKASALLELHWSRDKSDNQAPTAYDGTIIGHPAAVQFPTALDPAPYFSVGDNQAADWSATFRPQRDNTLQGISAKLNWDVFDGATLTSISAYDEFTRDESFETDGVPFQFGNTTDRTKIGTFSQEVRLASDDDTDLSWIAGGYYSLDHMSEKYRFLMGDSYGYLVGINSIDTRYGQSTDSAAGFAHVEWKFAEQFQLILGARYTSERRRWTGCTYDTGDGTLAAGWNYILSPYLIVPSGLPDPGALAAGGCGIYDDIAGSPTFGTFAPFTDKISTNKWMWKTGLNFTPTEDMLVYATISNGFKSGGFNGAPAQVHSQLLPYGPETLTAYELGLKSGWLDGRVHLNASVFYYDYRDKQEPTIAVTPVGNISGLTNVPQSRILGAEFELHLRPLRGLTVDLNGTYLDSKIVKYMAVSNNSVYPTVIRYDASGFKLSNAPEFQGIATVGYEWPLTDKLVMHAASDLVYKDSTAGSTQDLVSGYTLVNARLGIGAADDNWSVTLWGRNIFDEYYWNAASIGNVTYFRMNGMPATYGITFSHNF